jgi:hypothetical protein
MSSPVPAGAGFGSSPPSPRRRSRSASSITSASIPEERRPPAPRRRPICPTPAQATTAPTSPSLTEQDGPHRPGPTSSRRRTAAPCWGARGVTTLPWARGAATGGPRHRTGKRGSIHLPARCPWAGSTTTPIAAAPGQTSPPARRCGRDGNVAVDAGRGGDPATRAVGSSESVAGRARTGPQKLIGEHKRASAHRRPHDRRRPRARDEDAPTPGGPRRAPAGAGVMGGGERPAEVAPTRVGQPKDGAPGFTPPGRRRGPGCPHP